jgi:hypothetical protein
MCGFVGISLGFGSFAFGGSGFLTTTNKHGNSK